MTQVEAVSHRAIQFTTSYSTILQHKCTLPLLRLFPRLKIYKCIFLMTLYLNYDCCLWKILLYYIYSTYQRTLQFLFLTNLFPSSFVSSLTRFLLFFFLGKWSQKYFSRKKIILKILLKFRLFKEFKLIHITLLCSTIPLLPLYFC